MFEVENCVNFIMNKISKRLANKFNEALISEGSTRVQWLVMYHLYSYGEMNQCELSDKMNSRPSTIVRLIDRMEKEEIVQRTKSSKDRRVTHLSLTQKGEKRINDLMPRAEEMSIKISEGITDEEFQVFHKVLNKMTENADKINI